MLHMLQVIQVNLFFFCCCCCFLSSVNILKGFFFFLIQLFKNTVRLLSPYKTFGCGWLDGVGHVWLWMVGWSGPSTETFVGLVLPC